MKIRTSLYVDEKDLDFIKLKAEQLNFTQSKLLTNIIKNYVISCEIAAKYMEQQNNSDIDNEKEIRTLLEKLDKIITN